MAHCSSVLVLLLVLMKYQSTFALKCYKGFEPSLNATQNYGLEEECKENPILAKRGVRLACYTRIITESGDNKIMRGCANDIQICQTDVICWFCESHLCNTIGRSSTLNSTKSYLLLAIFLSFITEQHIL